MDETFVFFAIEQEGSVTRRATNKKKKRITVVLACCYNGEKFEPLVILDRPYRGHSVEDLDTIDQEPVLRILVEQSRVFTKLFYN